MNKLIIGAVTILLIAGGWYLLAKKGNNAPAVPTAAAKATVFYSLTCGCCSNYISYLKQKGFQVEAKVKDPNSLSLVKSQNKVPSSLEGCHTSVIGNYVVEGHVPVEAIQKLLTEKPKAAGIALAGMPLGSPGMGGWKKEPFQVRLITLEGEDGGLFMEL